MRFLRFLQRNFAHRAVAAGALVLGVGCLGSGMPGSGAAWAGESVPVLAGIGVDGDGAALVRLPAAELDRLREGDVLQFALPATGRSGWPVQGDAGSVDAPGGVVAVEITHDQRYVNGDRVLRGVDRGRSAMLVLTLNGQAAFADVMLDGVRWVFAGARKGDFIEGRFELPAAVTLDAELMDYVVRPRTSGESMMSLPGSHVAADEHAVVSHDRVGAVDRTGMGAPSVLPLRYGTASVLSQAPGSAQAQARDAAFAPAVAAQSVGGGEAATAFSTYARSSGGLRVEQHFSEPVIRIGQPTQLDVSIVVHNDGPRAVSNVPVDVYFILEDTRLLQAPAGCRQTVSRGTPAQPILSCRVPGTVAVGASRSLTYRVGVDAKLDPMRLWSTALVGGVRHDAHLNVVYDVITGAEAGGLSDFNLALLEHVPTDELGNVVIDILALYTPDAAALYGSHTATRINQMVSVTNQIYQDSGVGITLRPVFHSLVDYPAGGQVDMYTQLEQLTFGSHPAFQGVPQLRDHFGADLVVLFRSLGPSTRLCGVANLGGHDTWGDMLAFDGADYGFSLVALDCPLGSALAHELGHNMGLTHSHREDGGGGTFPWATGHGVDHGFATVMANPARFGSARAVPRFASPALECGGLPCGVDRADPQQGADAVHTLNQVRFQIAAYRPTRVPQLPWRTAGTVDGRPTAARIAMAATANGGPHHTHVIEAHDTLDVAASFYVDPAHIGRAGQFHILADLHQAGLGFAQLDKHGRLYEWNGEVSDLVAYNSARPLAAVEYLQVLSGFVPLAEMAGFPLTLFVAYQLPDTGELIYTTDPLVIDIRALPRGE